MRSWRFPHENLDFSGPPRLTPKGRVALAYLLIEKALKDEACTTSARLDRRDVRLRAARMFRAIRAWARTCYTCGRALGAQAACAVCHEVERREGG